jgi:predicted nucleic acid-binding protein
MILLDTDVVSALRRADRTHPNVVRWAEAIPADEQYISAVTILEIEVGVLRAERRDSAQGAILRRWLEEVVLRRFADHVLPFDLAAARRCAGLHVPDPRPIRDAMIAATALIRNMVVATRNVADFAPTGVRTINPWDAAP